jgi:hypothetical protein
MLETYLEEMEGNPEEQTHELEVVKRAVRISIRVRKMKVRTVTTHFQSVQSLRIHGSIYPLPRMSS